MSYATPQQLADALEVRLTPDNTQLLQDCLDAAATEIDHFMLDAYPEVNPLMVGDNMVPTIVVRVNVNRGVEWYKAPAAYNGGVGYAEIGTLSAPASGFERHSAVLLPLRARFGMA